MGPIALMGFLAALVIGLIGVGIYILFTKLRNKEEEIVQHHREHKADKAE